jgi:hypothetical protein
MLRVTNYLPTPPARQIRPLRPLRPCAPSLFRPNILPTASAPVRTGLDYVARRPLRSEIPSGAAGTGHALLFQHRLLHEGCPVRSGIKYVLRSDVMYRR